MIDFKNNTVRSRDYIFTDEEMISFRIRGVFNSTTDVDYMDQLYMEDFITGCYEPRKGECAIAESAIKTVGTGLVRILSVIVFEDTPSMELFILRNPKLYLVNDISMGGRMN